LVLFWFFCHFFDFILDFADTTDLFYDDATVIIEDPQHYREQRYIALGMDVQSRVVVVVHIYRDLDVIHIISARKADPKERRLFAGGL